MYMCDECNGNGYRESNQDERCICGKCNGYGHLNWIENIFGSIMEDVSRNTLCHIQEHNMNFYTREKINSLLHNYRFDIAEVMIKENLKSAKNSGRIYDYTFQHFKIDYLNSEFIEISIKVFKSSEEYVVRFNIKDTKK